MAASDTIRLAAVVGAAVVVDGAAVVVTGASVDGAAVAAMI